MFRLATLNISLLPSWWALNLRRALLCLLLFIQVFNHGFIYCCFSHLNCRCKTCIAMEWKMLAKWHTHTPFRFPLLYGFDGFQLMMVYALHATVFSIRAWTRSLYTVCQVCFVSISIGIYAASKISKRIIVLVCLWQQMHATPVSCQPFDVRSTAIITQWFIMVRRPHKV